MQQFYPYEELRCEFKGENELSLETPWTQIQVEYAEEDKSFLESLLSSLNGDGTKREDEVTEFLNAFKHNFISYSRPRALELTPDHCTRLTDKVKSMESSQPNDWINAYLPAVSHQIRFTENKWKWDIQAILENSRRADSNVYDPETAYRLIMRLVLLEMSSAKKGTKLLVDHLRKLSEKNEEVFFQAARLFVRQYHHITSTSSDCLMPAIYNMPYAQGLVMELANEELGHGKFTGSTYKALGGKHPYDTPVDPYTVGLMDLLRQSAHTNALAFATLFTIFEVSGEQDDDPLATLLAKSSRPTSGEGLQRHFQLNKDGAHFQSGFPLIEILQGVNRETVIEAARFSELLMNFFDLSAFEIIKATKI